MPEVYRGIDTASICERLQKIVFDQDIASGDFRESLRIRQRTSLRYNLTRPASADVHLRKRPKWGVYRGGDRRASNYPISAYSPAHIIGPHKTPMHGNKFRQDKMRTSNIKILSGSIR